MLSYQHPWWQLWCVDIPVFHMSVLNSNPAKFKIQQIKNLLSLVSCLWQGPNFHAESHNQEVMLHIKYDHGDRTAPHSTVQGTCKLPWQSLLNLAISPIQFQTPVLVQTAAFFCNNMSSLTICLPSTTFFLSSAILHH